jgi:drug/metabolite transporter (DMT)-like permease
MKDAASPPGLPVLVLLLSSTAWGLTWLPLKYFGGLGLSGIQVTAVAHGSICLLAVPFLWVRRGDWGHAGMRMAALAMAGGLANMTFSSAILYGNVLRVMTLFYLLPAWGVLGGALLLGERVTPRRWLSVGLALLGAYLALGAFNVFHEEPTWIDGLAVLSGFALALNNVLFRKAFDVGVPSKVAFTFVGSCLWASAVLLTLGKPASHSAQVEHWLLVAGFGLVYLLPASLATLWAVGRLEAGRSSVLIVAELLVAVGSAAWWNGQVPSLLEGLGGLLIVSAALLESRSPPAGPQLAAGPPRNAA